MKIKMSTLKNIIHEAVKKQAGPEVTVSTREYDGAKMYTAPESHFRGLRAFNGIALDGRVIHRSDGPAIIHQDGKEEWYFMGKRYKTEAEHQAAVKRWETQREDGNRDYLMTRGNGSDDEGPEPRRRGWRLPDDAPE